jgi:Protein of unknown function (DUF2637)
MLRTPSHPVTAESTADRTERLLAAVRVALVAALTALVLAIAALAYVVSFEAIRAFAIETAAFPPSLAWSAPLLVDSFTTAASLVILWQYLRGEGWRAPWYAWTLVACATAVSVALNVAHAPDRLSAQLFAALPPVALLGALELLMSVARTGLPHTSHTTAAEDRSGDRTGTATGGSSVAVVTAADGNPAARPQLPAPDRSPTAGNSNGSGPQRDSRARVRELVATERATGTRLHAREVAAAAGISQRRAYELLRAVRAEDAEEQTP